MSQQSTALGDAETRLLTGLGRNPPLKQDYALVVSPKRACEMLDCGLTKLYALIDGGHLDSYRDGNQRKIVVASITGYIAHQLQDAAAAEKKPMPLNHNQKIASARHKEKPSAA